MIRAHSYVRHACRLLIDTNMARPEAIDVSKSQFAQRFKISKTVDRPKSGRCTFSGIRSPEIQGLLDSVDALWQHCESDSYADSYSELELMFRNLLCNFSLTFCILTSLASAQQSLETDNPLPPLEASRSMVVPDGFNVSLFAGEPDVKQPIGFCIDDRGRLWVAEAYNYPHHGTKQGDRIVIFEDTDGNGEHDKRTVFYDKLNYVTGIEVGFGGVWVMSPPYFYFIPDQDGDDRPDTEPQVLLDGFGNHANAHNLANGFAWGPDGWLYGTHGRTNWSLLGKPGTADEDRVRFDGGVYRYHPIRHVWEPYADGTTNPWGIDWNDFGEAFVCNCVNPHLFHVIPGAHYEPWRNRESSQYAYERIETIADHLHFVGGHLDSIKQGIGGNNVRSGLGTAEEDAAGGGHAHCGTMIYLGDNWPTHYRNTLFTNNIHGKRINNDILKRSGSGYVASHGKDLMHSLDPWFMGVTLQYGPDGGVYVSDWSDTGECHSVRNTRRHTGRIFKITYGKTLETKGDLSLLSNTELVQLQLHPNDWYVRHARRLLQERSAQGVDFTDIHKMLRDMFREQPEIPRKLRALWALYVTQGLDDEFLLSQLNHDNEYIRSWAVRILCEEKSPSQRALQKFQQLATSDPSPYVRLYLASMLQRLKPETRWPIAEALVAKRDDQADENLPLMIWYGIEPLIHENPTRFVSMIAVSEIPLIRKHIARRAVSAGEVDQVVLAMGKFLNPPNDQAVSDLLTGILQGLEGERSVPMPDAWPRSFATLKETNNRQRAIELALKFNDPSALRFLREQAADKNAESPERIEAIQALVGRKVEGLAPLLLELLHDTATQTAALQGLAEYNHPETPTTILKLYDTLSPSVRQDAVQTMASRTAWAMRLLDAVEAKQIPRSDISAYTARQLRSLGDDQILEKVQRVWGEVRETPADKAKQIAKYKRLLTPQSLERADPVAGRLIFQKTCAKCHQFFGSGGKIGPDITGSPRNNIDYLLENMIDPNAQVSRDYQMQIILTDSGRIVTGLVSAETDKSVTIKSVNEDLVIPKNEISDRKVSPVSMMPEGQLNDLTTQQVRDLFAYLANAEKLPANNDK